MTMSNISKNNSNMPKLEQEGLCTRISLAEGLVSLPLSMDEIHFVSRMAKFMFEENHYPIFHSWDDEWTFRDVTCQVVAERTIARMRLCAFLLEDKHFADKTSIHIWCDGDTLAFALATVTPSGDVPLMTVAYTSRSQHHMDLVDRDILRFIDYSRVLEDGRKLVGFESYDIHNLKSYLAKIGVVPLITKDGYFKSDAPNYYPNLIGSTVLEANNENMAILGLIYSTY